jgi:putative transposase
MRYRFVAAERATFPVRLLCRVMGVTVSAFYAWRRRGADRRDEADRELGGRIVAIFEASRRAYGSPRVHAELRAQGVRVGRKRVGRERVARVMREGGLSVTRRRRVPRTTVSRHDRPIAPNLLERRFAAARPDAVWLADISYVPTGEGWLYLAAAKDMATREIVGWSMADHLRGDLARDALLMAIRRRQPPRGLIHPPLRPRGAGRIQAVVAMGCLSAVWSNASNASAGVFQSRVLRGLALRAAATAAISLAP